MAEVVPEVVELAEDVSGRQSRRRRILRAPAPVREVAPAARASVGPERRRAMPDHVRYGVRMIVGEPIDDVCAAGRIRGVADLHQRKLEPAPARLPFAIQLLRREGIRILTSTGARSALDRLLVIRR